MPIIDPSESEGFESVEELVVVGAAVKDPVAVGSAVEDPVAMDSAAEAVDRAGSTGNCAWL